MTSSLFEVTLTAVILSYEINATLVKLIRCKFARIHYYSNYVLEFQFVLLPLPFSFCDPYTRQTIDKPSALTSVNLFVPQPHAQNFEFLLERRALLSPFSRNI